MTAHARHHIPTRVASLHDQGDTRRLLVLARDDNTLRVESAQSFDASDAGSLKAALNRVDNPALIRIIPGAGAITRVVQLPGGADNDLLAALDLIAEAELPSTIPAHRRAAGVIPSPTANGAITAMLIGWPQAQTPDRIAEAERYTTVTAALNALLARATDTPDCAASYIDGENGAISLFANREGQCLARTLREDPRDATRWRDALQSATRNAGLKDSPDASTDHRLLIDQTTASRAVADIDGARADADWLDQYAVALGAALGAMTESATLAPLYELTTDAKATRESAVTRVRRTLAETRAATLLALIALACMLLAPLAGAFARHRVLLAKTGGLEEQREAERSVDRRLALNSELEQRTWPMTKLLADLAGLVPVGVTVESVQLIEGDEITIAGAADSAEILNRMQRTIAGSGVFADPALPRIERRSASSAGPVSFDLAARVVRPYVTPRGAEDFAEYTLAVHMYGEEAVARYPDDMITLVSPERGDGSAPRSQSRTLAGAGSTADEDATSAPRERARANERETQTIPDPLTDEQIASMDRSQLVKEFGLRRKASSYPELSAENEQRLKNEVNKIRERLANRGGG